MGLRAAAAAAACLLAALPSLAAAYGRQDRVVICTATGIREVVIGSDGKPLPDQHRDPNACAHLWCDPRRGRTVGVRPT